MPDWELFIHPSPDAKPPKDLSLPSRPTTESDPSEEVFRTVTPPSMRIPMKDSLSPSLHRTVPGLPVQAFINSARIIRSDRLKPSDQADCSNRSARCWLVNAIILMVGAEGIKQYIYYYKLKRPKKPIFLVNKTTYQINFDGAVVVVA